MKKWVYAGVILLTVYLNLTYRWPSGVWFLAAEICFLCICSLLALIGEKRLAVRMKMDKIMLEQKESSKVEIMVENRVFYPIPIKFILAYQYATDGKEYKTIRKLYLDGNQKRKLECEIVPQYCGKIEIQIKKLSCYDFMELCSFAKKTKEKLPATVMPKPYPVNLVVSSRTKWFPVDGESYAQDRSGDDNAEIYDVREYQAGDRMQKVHWKLSAREDTLYIKEFSYPLGAAVVLMLEENEQGDGIGNTFMEAAISISNALLEKSCMHYVVWKEKKNDSITRILVRDEEDLYECIVRILEFSGNALECNMEERYRYEYKNDTYATVVKVDTGMNLQVNGKETMHMLQNGLETFFHTVEIVV